MHYLFGFSGRINRAKMWLFLLVTFGWEIAIFLVAMFGMHWSHYWQALQQYSHVSPPVGPAPMPIPDPLVGNAWIAAAAIALMVVLYLVAYFAVIVKRLHDRNKSVKWLILYLVVPWALNAFVWLSGPMGRRGFPTELFVGQMGMARGVAYAIVCIIGLWVIIEFYFLRGTAGENRFGPDPLA
ncbi:MAG: DUF805 domain-containing protein [Rhizomicrobium sp.]